MTNEKQTIIENTMQLTGLKSFRDVAVVLLMSRKLSLKKVMHARMIYNAYTRFQLHKKAENDHRNVHVLT